MWHLVIDVLKSGRLEQATSFTRESESDLEVVAVVVVDDVGDRAREQHRARRIQPDNQTLIGSSTTYTIQRDVVNTKRPWSCDCS